MAFLIEAEDCPDLSSPIRPTEPFPACYPWILTNLQQARRGVLMEVVQTDERVMKQDRLVGSMVTGARAK